MAAADARGIEPQGAAPSSAAALESSTIDRAVTVLSQKKWCIDPAQVMRLGVWLFDQVEKEGHTVEALLKATRIKYPAKYDRRQCSAGLSKAANVGKQAFERANKGANLNVVSIEWHLETPPPSSTSGATFECSQRTAKKVADRLLRLLRLKNKYEGPMRQVSESGTALEVDDHYFDVVKPASPGAEDTNQHVLFESKPDDKAALLVRLASTQARCLPDSKSLMLLLRLGHDKASTSELLEQLRAHVDSDFRSEPESPPAKRAVKRLPDPETAGPLPQRPRLAAAAGVAADGSAAGASASASAEAAALPADLTIADSPDSAHGLADGKPWQLADECFLGPPSALRRASSDDITRFFGLP